MCLNTVILVCTTEWDFIVQSRSPSPIHTITMGIRRERSSVDELIGQPLWLPFLVLAVGEWESPLRLAIARSVGGDGPWSISFYYLSCSLLDKIKIKFFFCLHALKEGFASSLIGLWIYNVPRQMWLWENPRGPICLTDISPPSKAANSSLSGMHV